MARKPTDKTPTDEEIMSYCNVPFDVAAKYIGWSGVTVRYALQQERAPFGLAAQNPKTGSWSYNISPGLLVAYKRGELQAWKLTELIKLVADGFIQALEEQMSAARKATIQLLGGGSR